LLCMLYWWLFNVWTWNQ